MVRQTSKWGQTLLISLVGLGATAFATSWVYRLDEVITVQGRLVPKDGGVEVKSPINGQLDAVLIKNGDRVEEGQTLLRFDVKAAKAQEKTLANKLKIEKERLNDQLRRSKQRQKTLERNIDLTMKILERLEPLEENGAISELQILQQANQLEAQKDELLQEVTKSEELENDSKTRTTDLEGELQQLRSRLRNELIEAPISGTIFNLKADNNRYVAVNAEPLLKIVPSGKLSGKVNVGNQDIGFIRKGQKVKIRVNSFPYTEYGEINGEIDSIGADSLPPNDIIRSYHFPVNLNLERSTLETKEGLKIPLQAGMTITTNLKLRDRRLIELLGDLFTNKSESLKRLRQP